MRLELVDKRRRDRERASTVRGLWRAEVVAAVIALHRAANVEQAGVEVDVIPGESAQLAFTKSETESNGVQAAVAIVGDGRKEGARPGGREERALGPLQPGRRHESCHVPRNKPHPHGSLDGRPVASRGCAESSPD